METVFDALKAMGKATSVELAARLDISREEVLNELWELKRNGVVDKTGHTWFLAGEGESGVQMLSWLMYGRWRLTSFARRLSGTQKLQDWMMPIP
ncbi:hypothetical protein G3W01_00065 [Escherichia coli]|nr:hypothetical protein [Escherichia coli]